MNLLNTAPDEKLGYLDFAYATQDVPLAGQYEVVDNFIVPTGTALIVSGFVPSIAGNFLSVTAGTAFLGYRDRNGMVRNGLVVGVNTIATAALQKNLAGLTQGTYVAYVRFNLIPGTPENRAYYAASGSYAQLTNTRLTATWELNLEPSSITMTAEWLAIASVAIGSNGAVVTSPSQPVDLRNMYFDGKSTSSGAPAWGLTAASRNASITSLYTQLDALRQSIVDIKGPGLQGWRSPGIGGMNIGNAFAVSALAATVTQTAPLDATLALGDTAFLLQGVSSITGVNGPKLSFNAGSTGGSLFYNRSANLLTYNYGTPGAPVAMVGINSSGYLGVGTAAAAPVARLHVASNGGLPARFDAGSTSAGSMMVALNGYAAGDKVVTQYGDTAASGTPVARFLTGQLSANVFGLQQASGNVVYTYNPTTVSSFAGPTAASGLTAFSSVTGAHAFAGYVNMQNGATVTGPLVGNIVNVNYINLNRASNPAVEVSGNGGSIYLSGIGSSIQMPNSSSFITMTSSGGSTCAINGDMLPVLIASIGSNGVVIQQAGSNSITAGPNGTGQFVISFANAISSSAIVLLTPQKSFANDNQTYYATYSNVGTGPTKQIHVSTSNASGLVSLQFNIVIYALGI